MPYQTPAERCKPLLREVQDHLHNELLPFWRKLEPDVYGGYLTFLGDDGKPTGRNDIKTALSHFRLLFSASHTIRAGYDSDGKFREQADKCMDFLENIFWDRQNEGWSWVADRQGHIIDESKIGYGQDFGIYAPAEYALATGGQRGLELAVRTYEVFLSRASDLLNGGVIEIFNADWTPKRDASQHDPLKDRTGGQRKGFDIHMHLMEALTTLYEATQKDLYRRKTKEVIDLLFAKVVNPDTGMPWEQFTYDWKPLPRMIFDNVWGSDRDESVRPLDNTSYGHNVEFVWLLNHALDTTGIDKAPYMERMQRMVDHAVEYGVDRVNGGVFCDGAHDGPAREKNKEFWQQAECMVGFIDAYLLFGDQAYFDAYENVHRFVMDKMINHKVGEWLPLIDSQDVVQRKYMAHEWKESYHTVRAMLEVERRLMDACKVDEKK